MSVVFIKLPLDSCDFRLVQACAVQVGYCVGNSGVGGRHPRGGQPHSMLHSMLTLLPPHPLFFFFFFFFAQIQETLVRHAGMLRQFLTDDKGTVAILVWGCPPLAHLDNPARAALAALELHGALDRVRSFYGVIFSEAVDPCSVTFGT